MKKKTNILDTEGMKLLKNFLDSEKKLETGYFKKYYNGILNGNIIDRYPDALGYLIHNEEYELVKKFLEIGNTKNDDITYLTYFVAESLNQNNTEKVLDFMRYLIINGANINEYPLITYSIQLFNDGSINSSDTLLEYIKLLLELGSISNLTDSKKNTPLMLISEIYNDSCFDFSFIGSDESDESKLNNIEKILNLLLDNGADINARNNMGMTALMKYSLEGNEKLVQILIDRGADINITSSMAAFDLTTDDKIKEIISNSKNHSPQKLVKLLSNFTLDKPLKYSTHYWDFDLQKDYKNFDGYMKAVKENFVTISEELKVLSPTLHKKIEIFLFETEPNSEYSWCSASHINMGWSSIGGLKEWCDSGKKPSDFELEEHLEVGDMHICMFGDIINLFKQEIEIRSEFNNLSAIFDAQKMNINKDFLFAPENSKLDKQFYSDTQNLKEAITLIFNEINKRVQYPSIDVQTDELEDRSIEIKIIQKESFSNKSASELFKKANDGGGDIGNIKNLLLNLCDWSIESSYKGESFRINMLHSSNVKEIETLSKKALGFTHILRFYR